MRRFLAQARRFRTLYASTKGASTKSRLKLVRQRVLAVLGRRFKRVSRRGQTGHVSLAFQIMSPERANRFFWTSKTVSRNWYDVRSRLAWLQARHPDHVEGFVRTGLQQTLDGILLVKLARHPISAQWVEAHLCSDIPLDPEHLDPRFRRSQSFAAAYVGILMLTSGPDAAKSADNILRRLNPLPRKNYISFLDSVSTRTRKNGEQKSFNSGFCERKTHRLLIVEDARAYDTYSPLMLGAEKVTLFDMSDIYATTDLSVFDDQDLPPVTIEHIRSRITRFSRGYHSAHEESKRAAIKLTSHLFDRLPEGHRLRTSLLKRHVELDVADQVFFELLKVRAIEELLESSDFDHVVVVLESGKPGSSHYSTLSCVQGLAEDNRLEFTSVSERFSQRLLAQTCVTRCVQTKNPLRLDVPLPSTKDILDDLFDKCRKHVQKSVREGDLSPDSVVTLINFTPAYNPSTSAFVEALKSQFKTQTLFVGGSLNRFLKEDPDRSEILKETNPRTMSWALLGDLSDFSRWCLIAMSEAIESLDDPAMAHLCRCFIERITTNGIRTSLSLFILTYAWCHKQKELNQLPSLALVTTQRSAKLGIMAEAMRQFAIPSLALEPHGLNGNYCRYAKVAMDHYAVISQYFANTAEQDFGVGPERCHIIGTPRIIAPKHYDQATAFATARQVLLAEQNLQFTDRTIGVFFCQPSEWAHVEAVWRNVLLAAQCAGSDILLKPHPEESPSRVARYLTVAKELGMEKGVKPVAGKPDVAIEACDFVLTGYSAAALDAAVLGKPVFCVTANGEPYPVDQHAIANAPLCGSAKELEEAITNLISNPEGAAKRAADFLVKEPQFVDGPNERLRSLVASLIEMHKTGASRSSETPKSLFLDGPFKEYSV